MSSLKNFNIQNFLNLSYCCVIVSDYVRQTRFQEYIKATLEKEFKLKNPNIETIEFTNKSDLLYKLQSQDLFSEHKIVFLNFKKELNSTEAESLLEVTKIIPLKTTLIINIPKLKKNLKFYKKVLKDNCIVEFTKLEDKSLYDWIYKECKRQEINKYPKEIASILELLFDSDLDQISKAIYLLATYSDNNEITLKNLKDFFPEALSPNEFHLMDAIIASNPGRVEQILSELFAVGKNPFLILALLNSNYQRLLNLKVMLTKNESKATILKTLNLKDWLLNKLLIQIKNLSIIDLQKAVSNLLWADSRLKDKSLGGELIISDLCGKLCVIHAKR